MTARRGAIDLWSGVGLVASNMIGAGVFVSAGFMTQAMSPTWILLSWLCGAIFAMAGARAYAEIAILVPRSGGEYRYLSDLVHPMLGYLAGWASLLVGFAAPVAINALAAAGFLSTIMPVGNAKLAAVGIIVALTASHSIGLRASKWSQNLLAAAKITLVVGFVGLGLVLGAHAFPTWSPPGDHGLSLDTFLGNQFFVAFAFSGWNAAIYVAEEFKDGRRDVPRAMLIGCAAVAVIYLLINWVVVANVTPAEVQGVLGSASENVGHVVTRHLIGEVGGGLMSALVALALISAASAMTMVGPRVTAAMARDGFLPRVMAGRDGKPPVGSVILQGAIAIVILWLHSLHEALQNVGAVLTLFAALTVLALFKLALAPGDRARPRPMSLVAGVVFVGFSAWTLYFGFARYKSMVLWVVVISVCSLVAYVGTVLAQLQQRVTALEAQASRDGRPRDG